MINNPFKSISNCKSYPTDLTDNLLQVKKKHLSKGKVRNFRRLTIDYDTRQTHMKPSAS